MLDFLHSAFMITALIVGFGFVVFFHELGHFLAAKWVGIKVEQFAVGFGHAVVSWRKGLGFTWGSSAKRLAELEKSGVDVSQISETEYRFNWMPLGGYVKMLGQDDMNPNATSEDPRSFNKKSIRARMLVVSAGVIMNVILAAILFMVVFLIGHRVQPPTIGAVQIGSPIQLAGGQSGDRIVRFDGGREHSFNQLLLDVALVRQGKSIPVQIERAVMEDGQPIKKTVELDVHPQKPTDESSSFYAIGMTPISDLKGLDPKKVQLSAEIDPKTQILPGDVITAVDGVPVEISDYPVLDRAVQSSRGNPVRLTVQDKEGQQRTVTSPVRFGLFFGESDSPYRLFNIAGMQPPPQIGMVIDGSPMKDKLQPGDVVVALIINGDRKPYPSVYEFRTLAADASERKLSVDFEVERGGKRQVIEGVVPNVKLAKGKRGVGVELELATGRPIVTDVLADSPAKEAGVPRGALITRINGTEVKTWFDVHQRLRDAGSSAKLAYVLLDSHGQAQAGTTEVECKLPKPVQETLANIRYAHELLLAERVELRQTNNPLLAASWGVTETRDMLRQFYVTLRRVFEGRVSATNFMGPVGIVQAGSFFAQRGWDWLIWFLAMISANLAVVNFLPIPIVDGGLFLFLIIEKVSGKPLSPKMQTVAQLVGLAIILSVFLLVTYQDIRRLIL